MIVAVDFDGTCVTNKYPKCGRNIGAGPVLRLLQSKGVVLMLWTMRGRTNVDWAGRTFERTLLQDALDWASNEGIHWDSINTCPLNQSWTDSNKQFADVYIDDLAIGAFLKNIKGDVFIDWYKVLDWFFDKTELITFEERNYTRDLINAELRNE